VKELFLWWTWYHLSHVIS